MKSNNFVNKGLHKDNDINLQPEGTFRDSLNARIISHGDGNYSWENIKGTTVSFTLCDNTFEIIGGCQLREKLIIFSVKGSEGVIGEVVINKDGLGAYYPKYRSAGLNFSIDHPIGRECYGYYENESVQRVYWTDNYNLPRAINMASLGYVASGSIVADVVYQVTCGTVTYNGNPYTAGSTFTGVLGVTNYSPTSPGYVVEYINPDILDFYPEIGLGEIDFDSIISGGHLVHSTYMYAYRLYTDDGLYTDWSYLSRPIHVTQYPVGTVNQYQAYQGENIDNDTTKGIRIQIDDINTNFDNIEVVSFESSDYNVVGNGYIFFRGNITSSTMTFDHLGGEDIGVVTIDELVSTSIVIEKVGTIANIKQYASMANLQEASEFDATITATIATEVYELPTDWTGHPAAPPPTPPYPTADALAGHNGYNGLTSADDIYAGQYYKVRSTPVNYLGNKNVGDVFQGVAGTINFVGGGVVDPIIRIKRFYDVSAGTTEYKDIVISDGYLDYKGEAVDKYCRGYWGKETYRIGFLPYNKYGKPMYVRWLGDVTIPQRNSSTKDTNTFGITGPGLRTPIIARMLKGYNSYADWNIQAMSLIINDLDLTDIIDEISGFSIVRAPLENEIQSEGLLTCTVLETSTSNVHPFESIRRFDTTNAGGASPFWVRQPYYYNYYSPEHLLYFGQGGVVFPNTVPYTDSDDLLEIEAYLTDVNYLNTDGKDETSNYHSYYKLYNDTVPSARGAAINAQNGISFWSGVEYDVADYAHPLAGGLLYYGHTNAYAYMGATGRHATSSNSTYVATTYAEPGVYPYGFGDYDDNGGAASHAIACYIAHKKPLSNKYGGTSPSALANTQYIHCGHYQEIDASVKAKVLNAGSYIFNNIQVFGGDCFIGIFDIARLFKNFHASTSFSQGVGFPVQSRINVALRQGRHLFRDRSTEPYSGGTHTNGINYDSTIATGRRLEVWNYNDSYSTNDSSAYFPALPEEYQFETQFDYRHRWSQRKLIGEEKDNFRVFYADDFRDVESRGGSITNVRAKNGRLFYWQEHAVGYMPINERAMINNPLGEALQIGTGGVYERFDEGTGFYGNQHKLSLVETLSGFAWFDFDKSSFIHMDTNLGMKNDSIVSGLYQYFRNNIDKDLKNYDNPFIGKGIVSGYNEKYNQVFMTFKYYDRTLVAKIAWLTATAYVVGDVRAEGGLSYVCISNHTSGVFATDLALKRWALINNMHEWQQYTRYKQGDMVWYNTINDLYICIDDVNSITDPATDTAHFSYHLDTEFNLNTNIKDVTVGYSDLINAFTGFYSFTPSFYMNMQNNFYSSEQDGYTMYLHDSGNYGEFYGSTFNSYLDIVINENFEIRKIFDNFGLVGNSSFFKNIYVSNSEQSGSDLNITDATGALISTNHEYRNKQWIGNLPFDADGNRFRGDGYIVMRFEYDNNVNELIKFLKLTTTYRQEL